MEQDGAGRVVGLRHPRDGMEPSSGTMFLAEETARAKKGDSNVLSNRIIQASRAGWDSEVWRKDGVGAKAPVRP